LLICDEPVSALDMSIQRQILDLLAAIRARRSLAMLFISHDLRAVAAVCDRIAVMKDGVIVEVGACARLMTRPDHPYTRELLQAAALPPESAPAGPSQIRQAAITRA
jgi:peptide/nickel transport system ATP-binding protein